MNGWRGYGPAHGVWAPDSEAFAFAVRHIEDLPERDRIAGTQMWTDGCTAAEWTEWFFSGCYIHVRDAEKGGGTE